MFRPFEFIGVLTTMTLVMAWIETIASGDRFAPVVHNIVSVLS